MTNKAPTEKKKNNKKINKNKIKNQEMKTWLEKENIFDYNNKPKEKQQWNKISKENKRLKISTNGKIDEINIYL